MKDYLKQAEYLHHQIPVADAHLDLAGEILLRHKLGETNVIRRHYLSNWRVAGFRLIVSSIYVENTVFFPPKWEDLIPDASDKSVHDIWMLLLKKHALCWEQGYANALEQIRVLKQEIASAPDELCLITSSKDLTELKRNHQIGILLYMEGLDCIGTEITRIHTLYQSGVRGASLTWSRRNLLASGCCTATQFTDVLGGITPLGLQVLDELNRHPMFLDISHLNNEGFSYIAASSKTKPPYIATHSNAWAIHPGYRNLTDEQLRTLAGQDGILGINACKYIAGSAKPHTLDALCTQIEYIQTLIGASHVGFGFDLCDSYSHAKYYPEVPEPEDCLRNHKEALLLTARLLERGMPEQTVLSLIGLNWFRYFEQLLP